MVCRKGDTEMVAHEDMPSQGAREGHGQADEADVDMSFIEEARKVLHGQLTGVDIDARPGPPEQARLLLEDSRVGGRADITNLNAADFATTSPASNALRLRELRQDVSGFGEKNLTG
jgi:hypothetical protein